MGSLVVLQPVYFSQTKWIPLKATGLELPGEEITQEDHMLGVELPEEERLEIGIIFKILTTCKSSTKQYNGLQQTMTYPV